MKKGLPFTFNTLAVGLLTTLVFVLNYGLPGVVVPLAFYGFYKIFSFSLVVIVVVLHVIIMRMDVEDERKLLLQLLAFGLLLLLNLAVMGILDYL